jgi:hypothetical protein
MGFELGRIGEVSAGVADFQGEAPGSSPTSGTCFPCPLVPSLSPNRLAARVQ